MPKIDNSVTERSRNGQPHFQHIGGVFSITISAHDAVPQQLLDRAISRRKDAIFRIETDSFMNKSARKAEVHKKFFLYMEELLHAKREQEYPFQNAAAAQAVVDRVWKYDQVYYGILSYTVMPNHVHLQLDFSVQCPIGWDGISPIKGYRNLAQVIGHIKGGAACDVNNAINRSGKLWRPGYYDRYMRNNAHIGTTFWYFLRNPEKAGLVANWRDHPFTYGTPTFLT
jgi:hypothetical protein